MQLLLAQPRAQERGGTPCSSWGLFWSIWPRAERRQVGKTRKQGCTSICSEEEDKQCAHFLTLGGEGGALGLSSARQNDCYAHSARLGEKVLMDAQPQEQHVLVLTPGLALSFLDFLLSPSTMVLS